MRNDLRFAGPADPARLRVAMDDQIVQSLRTDGEWADADLPTPAWPEVKVPVREGIAALSWLDLMLRERHPAPTTPQAQPDQ